MYARPTGNEYDKVARRHALRGRGPWREKARTARQQRQCTQKSLYYPTMSRGIGLKPFCPEPAAGIPGPRLVSEAPADVGAEGGEGPHGAKPCYTLAGVRFPALSAAGPSGARPEHLREALAIRKRPLANRLLRAVGELIDAASSGALPECGRWLLSSRLVFLQKKSGPAPRPIRGALAQSHR